MAKYGQTKYGTARYGTAPPLWIFDRTAADLSLLTSKAYINYDDLNRIEMRMQELTDALNSFAYVNNITTKTDWKKQESITDDNIGNLPVKSQTERIIDNINTLRAAFWVYSSTPQTPENMEKMTIYKMNDIEKILYDLYKMLSSMKNKFRRCGTFNCGKG